MDKALRAVYQLTQNTKLTKDLAPRPPRGMEPEEMDLHHLDYQFPKVGIKTQGSKLLSEQKQPQSLANSSVPPSKSHLMGAPSTSKPSYTNIHSSAASPSPIETEKARQADQNTKHVIAEKTSDKPHQEKETKSNHVRKAGIRQAGTHLPVGQQQLNMSHSWTTSASTVVIPGKSIMQSGIIDPSNKDEAKAPIPEFYGRDQFAIDAARGNIDMVRRFIAAYPETDAGPSEYSPSPLMEAAKNGHLDVVEALLPKASEQIRIDTLYSVCWAAKNEEQRTKLEPIVRALAPSVEKKNRGDVFYAANFVPGSRCDFSHYSWISATLLDPFSGLL